MDADRWKRAEQVIDAVLTRNPSEWEAVLDERCSGDAELRREVEGLLARLHRAKGFLESPPVNAARALIAEAQEAGHPSTESGRRIGAYRVVREIGRGGMSRVFLAERADGQFAQQVAIKLLRPGLDSEIDVERFRAERQILASLGHANIARILDGGLTDDGLPYLVLELVDGVPIDAYCEAGRLTLHQRLDLFGSVIAAVQHAHQNLVVHRDLKPSNILVTRDGAVKLLDFGVAKLLEPGPAPDATRTAHRWMTPEYAAPEQVRGDAITTLTDVYQLGAVLFQLVAQRTPFGGRGAGIHELEEAILHEEPAPPSSIVGMPAAIRADIDAIVLKALRKEPEQRYVSPAAMLDDIARIRDGRPVLARPGSTSYRLRKLVRRNRVAVAAASVTLFALLGATAFSLAQMREAQRQRDEALAAQGLADAQVEFQHLMLDSFGTERITMQEVMDQGRTLLASEFMGEPRAAAQIALALADRYGALGELAKQAELVALAESLSVAGGAREILLLSRCARANNLTDLRRTAEATALIDSIRPLLETASPAAAATCLALIADIAIKNNQFDSAFTIATRASRTMEEAGLAKGTEYIGVLITEANALENLKRRREALAMYSRIAAMLDSSGRGRSQSRNVIRNNIGIALSNLGEMRAAEPVLRETVEEFRRSSTSGFIHPAILINYCRTLLFLGPLDSAATWYRLLHDQSKAQDDAFMTREGAQGMVRVELLRRRADSAAYWLTAWSRAAERLPNKNRSAALALDGALASLRGDHRAAAAKFDSSLAADGYGKGTRSYLMRAPLIDASESALAAGETTRALEFARAAHGIATSDSLTEMRSAYVGEARLLEGRALLAAGDTAGARAALARAVAALRAGVGAEHWRTKEAERLSATLAR